MKMTPVNRLLLLATAILAAYQIAVGIEGLAALPTLAYTVAFGVLLIAVLLLMIMGFEVLETPAVVIASTVIPLALSLGLVLQYLPSWGAAYIAFSILGFLAVILTRVFPPGKKLQTVVLAIVHGIAGLTIFLLPIGLASRGVTNPAFALVGLGGVLIGIGGLLLSFLKMGRPLLPRVTILRILPGLLFCMTLSFVLGFMLG
jgi:hypothetical protein